VAGHGGNTLVVRAGAEWNREMGVALRDGLASSRRRDAGLLVLILFPDGTLMRTGAELSAEFNELRAELEAPLVVNEDVGGSWSKALRLDDSEARNRGLEWRLVSPTGGMVWGHRGAITSDGLRSAVDDYLFPSPPPAVTPVDPGVAPGTRASALGVGARLGDYPIELESRCPPPPLGRFGVGTVVAFVAKNSASSEAALRQLREKQGRFAVVIVDGAGAMEVAELGRSLPEGTLVIPDANGAISKRFGVRTWPSSVTFDETGRTSGLDVGVNVRVDGASRPPSAGEAL
jgi:hypothetical protein